jgi:hypothetical protein
MSTSTRRVLLVSVILVVAIGAAFFAWKKFQTTPQGPETPTVPRAAPTLPLPTITPQAAVPTEGAEAAIQYPVESAANVPLTAADMGTALTGFLGRRVVSTFFQLDDFPRRFVATVDNLGQSHAPPMLWPIHPTPDRFTVETQSGELFISADNSLRYAPLVLLAEAIDTRAAVDLYLRMYPLFQRAYEELGYPKRYFNDRLIAVMDQLLATPDAKYPTKVQLTEVKGSVPSIRPWVRYEFVDPALEARPAGQKILLRVGLENQRRLKAKLSGIRQELIKRVTPR